MSSTKDTKDKMINGALSAEDLEGVTGGVEMRTTKTCPTCRENLLKRYVVFPFHKYRYFCPVCNQYRDDVEEKD